MDAKAFRGERGPIAARNIIFFCGKTCSGKETRCTRRGEAGPSYRGGERCFGFFAQCERAEKRTVRKNPELRVRAAFRLLHLFEGEGR